MRLPSCFICARPVLWENSLCGRCRPCLDQEIEQDILLSKESTRFWVLLLLSFAAFWAVVWSLLGA